VWGLVCFLTEKAARKEAELLHGDGMEITHKPARHKKGIPEEAEFSIDFYK